MNKIITAVLLLIANSAMGNSFTYNIQQAGYDFDQYDEKGAATYDKFVAEFRAYPWSTQVGKSNGGSEATISVENHTNNTSLWVSVIGDASEYAHLVGIVYQKEKSSMFWYRKTEASKLGSNTHRRR